MQELPLNPGQLLFIAKGHAASRYRMTQFKTSWPDALVRVTGRVWSLQDKREQCASEVTVAVTGRALANDRRRSSEWSDALQRMTRCDSASVQLESSKLPQRPDVSDRVWPDAPRVRSTLRTSVPSGRLTGHAGPTSDRTRRLQTLTPACLTAALNWPDASGRTMTASGAASGHLCDLRSPLFLFRLPAQ
jgi:hypothetical protein